MQIQCRKPFKKILSNKSPLFIFHLNYNYIFFRNICRNEMFNMLGPKRQIAFSDTTEPLQIFSGLQQENASKFSLRVRIVIIYGVDNKLSAFSWNPFGVLAYEKKVLPEIVAYSLFSK